MDDKAELGVAMTYNSQDVLSFLIKLKHQHSKLDKTLSYFKTLIQQADKNAKYLRVFTKLQAETIEHFSSEEQLMADVSYPNFEQHKKNHMEFISALADMHSELLTNKDCSLAQLTHYIEQWFEQHNITDDIELEVFLSKFVE